MNPFRQAMMMGALPALIGALIHQLMIASGIRIPTFESLIVIAVGIVSSAVTLRHFISLNDPDRDPLTDLFNKRFFSAKMRVLASPKRYAPPCGVVLVDVDNFKKINDTHGHASGDAILATLASRLKNATRDRDVIARLGGDEFGILLIDIFPDLKVLETIAGRLVAALAVPVAFRGNEITCSISLGTGLWDRKTDPDKIMRLVDEALYEAKRSGKNRYAIAEDQQ